MHSHIDESRGVCAFVGFLTETDHSPSIANAAAGPLSGFAKAAGRAGPEAALAFA
jgi:hypothetical protein